MPLKVIAISQDKYWCFVSSHICSGWVNIKDIAYVDDGFVKKYLSYSLGACTREHTIIDNGNGFINFAEIGTILPLEKGKILCPFRKINGYAGIVLCSRANFKRMPVIFCSSNVRDIAFQFLGQKYGWGGDFESRDCSMLTMDFFSVFGIYIPRNSKGQLSDGYVFKSQENKEGKILKAIPWLTIVGKPGHVMLYIGQYNNKPVLLHNVFGFKILGNSRFVIGRTYLATTSKNELLKGHYYSLLNIISHMKQVALE